MKPTVKVATARTPDGGEMMLYQHDRDFTITVNGEDLMLSRHHESELELARLGCAHLAGRQEPSILIGGLGMGYTLRQALDMLSSDGEVVVGELLDAVVEWNREFFGDLNGQPLADERVELNPGDIFERISRSRGRFDAILLDIDNGPSAMTDTGNSRLNGYEGIWACRLALRKQGCLAVWSAGPSKEFEQLLMSCGFHVRRYRVPAFKGSKSQSRFVWVASEDKNILPPGGGEPNRPRQSASKGSRRRTRKGSK
jgi:spermidine synthase